MIASERSLASAHKPPQRRQSVVKSKNGTAKPPVRPVKVYVLDPKTLQQKLEAYVGQKNKKEADEGSKKESEGKDPVKPATTTAIVTSSATVASSTSPTTARCSTATVTTTTSKPSPPKQFPPIAPKLPSITPQNQQMVTTASNEGAVLGNGVTLQCISGFGLPAGPVMVTNGVALLQTAQSSIQAGGLFLSGITSLPNVIGSGTNGPGVKPKASSPKKRKVKKRKTGKKKKLDKEQEDFDESELAYLRKETTTRLGRISRPVSRPRSPSFPTLTTATNSRVPSPSHKRMKIEFRSETCLQAGMSQEELNLHSQECQRKQLTHRETPSHSLTSTNKEDTIPALVPVSLPQSISDIQTDGARLPSEPISTSPSTTATNAIVPTLHEVNNNPNELAVNSHNLHAIDNFGVESPSTATTPVTTTTTAGATTSLSINLDLPHTNEYFPDSSSKSNRICDDNFNEVNHASEFNCSTLSMNIETNLNTSLVPTTEEPKELLHRATVTSNVDLVPSSYSIPSSPPSQCQSPGFPDNNIHHNSIAKEGTNSPERVCHSPVDPMLLRSRSPFLPPIRETSLPAVSVSNLSIPEESLCRGELFMDLGESIMETTGMDRISPFCESASERLFSNSSMKPASQLMDEASVPDIDLNAEPESDNLSSTPSHVVAPILTTEDANDGEIFQTANYARNFVHPSTITHANSLSALNAAGSQDSSGQRASSVAVNGYMDFPKSPQSSYMESDVSMDSSEVADHVSHSASQKKRSVWQFVKEQIHSCGISQACGEISEMADKLSRIARDQFIAIREEEIERLGNSFPIINVDTPFFSHLLDLPFGTYIFKEDAGRKKKVPPPPPITSSELSFTGGVDDVEKFLPPNIDLIALPHLTNLDLI